MTTDLRLDPYPFYAQMRKTAPVVYSPEQGAWFIYSYDEVKRVMSDYQSFSSEVLAGVKGETILEHSIQMMDPPRHTKLRALATHAFTPKAIADLEVRIREITRELLDKLPANGQFEFVGDFAVPLPVIVIAEMLGIPISDRERFKYWSDVMVESNVRAITGQREPLEEHVAAYREMRAYFMKIAAERRANPQADLVSRLSLAEIDGERLTDAEVVDFCMLLLVAGNETTTNLLTNAIRCFTEFPDQWELLCRQPELIPQAIEEVLRHRSPVQGVFRLAKQDVAVGGQTIKAGQLVFFSTGSANRDESKFADPDRFDVTRPVSPHLSFGHGIHFCLGAPLARLEAKVAFEAMVERFKSFAIPQGAELEPLPTFLIFGLKRLPLHVAFRTTPE